MESFLLITIILFKPCSQVRCLTCFAMVVRVSAEVKRKEFRKNRDSVLCGDPARIQTWNLLIRSQILYSVKLRGLLYFFYSLIFLFKSQIFPITIGMLPAGRQVFSLSLIHISEPTRLGMISYAVFCLKK